jgi:hypothetical protein
VDFISGGVVEVLPPIDCAAWNRGDVKRAGTAGNGVSLAEFGFAGTECDDRSGNGSDQSLGWKDGQGMKAIAEQARAEAVGYGETTFPIGAKAGDGLPIES